MRYGSPITAADRPGTASGTLFALPTSSGIVGCGAAPPPASASASVASHSSSARRSSYRIGENRTTSVAVLCPGSTAIGELERAKLPRAYRYTALLFTAAVAVAVAVVVGLLCGDTGLVGITAAAAAAAAGGGGGSYRPLGVARIPPSGLNARRRKKPEKFSSPYRRSVDLAPVPVPVLTPVPAAKGTGGWIRCLGEGGARMAGSGGIGDGERMLRAREAERLLLPPTCCEGAGAGASEVTLVGGEATSRLLPLKLDRRLGVVCGGFIACMPAALAEEKGLGGTEALGVAGRTEADADARGAGVDVGTGVVARPLPVPVPLADRGPG